jgi:DNA-binding SARP family transcriptional activator
LRDTGDFVRLDVLGPMRARHGDVELILGPPKQRVVLGLLASRAGQVVSFGEIVDAVWDSKVPGSAANGVHTYISGIRRMLEPGRGRRDPGQMLGSVGGGYVLRIERENIDAEAFVRRHAHARRALATGETTTAIEVYDRALGLWRGEAYSNVPGSFAAGERVRLQELRLTAVEEWAGLMIDLGREAEVIAALSNAVARDPLRERLCWLLMLALYRCGRQAHALSIFRETRQLLSQELGIEPGLDLRRLHRDILAGEVLRVPAERRVLPATPSAVVSPQVPRPAQLPPSPRGFVGRRAELARLRYALDPARSGGSAATCAVIDGPAGVGKTALLLELGHELSGWYPDGQLFVDMGGSDPARPPLTASKALHFLLISLGVDPARIPAGGSERAALYAAIAYGQRLLVILDDAVDADQVRPLVPPGPAAVLVTSRRSPSGQLAPGGTYRMALSPLSPADSHALLACLVGAERLAAQERDAARLAALCGHLPLALRIAAESLMADPDRRLSELVHRYRPAHGRLEQLSMLGDTAANVRTAIAASCKRLPAPAARMFGLLGLSPAQIITVSGAATLANTHARRAMRQLETLAKIHLLERVGAGEYRLPPLVDIYATECARQLPARRSASGPQPAPAHRRTVRVRHRVVIREVRCVPAKLGRGRTIEKS